MLESTSGRRASLAELGFTCRCDRCATLDTNTESCRLLRCFACPTKGLTVRFVAREGGWRCTACGNVADSFQDTSILLYEESVVWTVCMRYFFQPKCLGGRESRLRSVESSRVARDMAPLRGLVLRWCFAMRCRTILGDLHWLTALTLASLARCLHLTAVLWVSGELSDDNNDLLEMLLFCKDRYPNGVMKELTEMLQPVMLWFRKNMPGSPQEAKFHCTYWQMLTAWSQKPVCDALPTDEDRAVLTVVLHQFHSSKAIVDFSLIQHFLALEDFSK